MKSRRNIIIAASFFVGTIQTTDTVQAFELALLLPKKENSIIFDNAKQQQAEHKKLVEYIKKFVTLDDNDQIIFKSENLFSILAALNNLPDDESIVLKRGTRWEVKEIKEEVEKEIEIANRYDISDLYDSESKFYSKADEDKAIMQNHAAQKIQKSYLDHIKNKKAAQQKKSRPFIKTLQKILKLDDHGNIIIPYEQIEQISDALAQLQDDQLIAISFKTDENSGQEYSVKEIKSFVYNDDIK